MKTGKQVVEITAGMRFQQRVMIGEKWYVLTDVSVAKFELEESESGELFETDRPNGSRHLVEFELDLYVS